MGFMRNRSARRHLASGFAAVFLSAIATGAVAGGPTLYEERVHADSYGNLVIYSPAGYKRIVVGKGYLADEYAARSEGPRVVYLEGEELHLRPTKRCVRPPVLLHGRSYMYGLPRNVVPVPNAGLCE